MCLCVRSHRRKFRVGSGSHKCHVGNRGRMLSGRNGNRELRVRSGRRKSCVSNCARKCSVRKNRGEYCGRKYEKQGGQNCSQ